MLRYLKAMPWLIFIVYTSAYGFKQAKVSGSDSPPNVKMTIPEKGANQENKGNSPATDTSVERGK